MNIILGINKSNDSTGFRQPSQKQIKFPGVTYKMEVKNKL